MLEKVIQLHILRYLKSLPNCKVGKTKTMGVKRGRAFCFDPYLMRGKCDLEAFYNGIMYGIEVKSEKGKLRLEPIEYKEFFHKPPDRIYVEAHSLEDVTKVLY